MKKYCYFNGKIIPQEKASLNLYDIGFLRGFSVFDYLKVYQGKPFLLKEHLDRLDRSAKKFGLKVPLSQTKITAVIHELIKKNKASTCAVRLVLTGGIANGLEWNKKAPTFVILIESAPEMNPKLYTKGGKLLSKEFDRPVWDAKHINYSFAVAHQGERRKAGAIEILYLWNGEVREASTSNIFIVIDGKIITPKDHVLHGITRGHVIKLAKKEFSIEERRVTALELFAADEVFITSSNKEVMPIVAIDGRLIARGHIGPVSKRLMNLFTQSIEKHIKS